MALRAWITVFSQKVKAVALTGLSFLTQKVTKENIALSAAAAIGTLASLNLGLNSLLRWIVGPPRMSREARLERVVSTLEFKRTLLIERQESYARRLDRIARLLHNINKSNDGPVRNRLRGWLDETVKTHQRLLEEKEIPRLTYTIQLLEEAQERLQDED